MSRSFMLGRDPGALNVIFVRNADWNTAMEIRKRDGSPHVLPSTAKITLRITTRKAGIVSYQAVIDQNIVYWSLSEAEVDNLLQKQPTVPVIWYEDGELDEPWFIGRIEVRKSA